jgi:hypothetical protein
MKQLFFGSLIIELEVGAQCADLWRQEWVNEIENDESVEKTRISGQLFFFSKMCLWPTAPQRLHIRALMKLMFYYCQKDIICLEL